MAKQAKTATDIVKWAEGQTVPAHTPAYRRLTDTDRVLILKYAKDGLTQVEIAQRLGCDQSSVSRWLTMCEDTTAQASQYLRGQALHMARKIRNTGKPSDLISALKGVNVLAEEAHKPGVTVLIGIKDSDVQLTLSPPGTQGQGESVQNT